MPGKSIPLTWIPCLPHRQCWTRATAHYMPARSPACSTTTPSHLVTPSAAHPDGHTHNSQPTCDEVRHEQQPTTCQLNRQHAPQPLAPSHLATPSTTHPDGHTHDSQPTCNKVRHEQQLTTCQLNPQHTLQPLTPSLTIPPNTISPCRPEGSIPIENFNNASKETGSLDGNIHDSQPTCPASPVLNLAPDKHEQGDLLLVLSIGESRPFDFCYSSDNIFYRLVPWMVPYCIQLPTTSWSWHGILWSSQTLFLARRIFWICKWEGSNACLK